METNWKLPQATKGFGVELEFHIPDYAPTTFKNKNFKFFNDFHVNHYCHLKGDGSCGKNSYKPPYENWCGLELNLGIFPLDEKGINHYKDILGLIYHDISLLKEKVRCHKPITRACGFHVHVSKSLFKAHSIKNFFDLFYRFQEDIFDYLVHRGRGRNPYCRKLRKNEQWFDDHCLCVNKTWHGTIEIRHSGMTSNQESLINWIKFIHLMHAISQDSNELKEFMRHRVLTRAIKGVECPEGFMKNDFIQWAKDSPTNKFPLAL